MGGVNDITDTGLDGMLAKYANGLTGALCAKASDEAAKDVPALVAALRSERLENEQAKERWNAEYDARVRAVAERDAARAEVEWRDEWSNSIANRMPEEYDGEDAQEAIIDRWLDDTAAELERERTQNREARTALKAFLSYPYDHEGELVSAVEAERAALSTQEESK